VREKLCRGCGERDLFSSFSKESGGKEKKGTSHIVWTAEGDKQGRWLLGGRLVAVKRLVLLKFVEVKKETAEKACVGGGTTKVEAEKV